MKALFPANDFSLLAVVLLMPLLGAVVNGIFGRRLGKDAVCFMTLVAVGASFLAAILTFLTLDSEVGTTLTKTVVNGHEVVKHGHAKLVWTAWDWMTISGPRDSTLPIQLKFSVDALSGVMMLVVTGVGFLIHVYATSYMAGDPAYGRFFAYLNLFIFSMLVLVLGDNLPVLFVGWEGVGLCSYLLIGFWYSSAQNAQAGKKAFIANRIGDFGLLCGMFLLVYYTGALDWEGLATNAQNLLTTNDAQQIHLWPIGGGQFQDTQLGGLTIPLHHLQPAHPWTITAATAVGLALFLGCTGKSAQIPLYTWLPDAMAGPTPVSALIHAATMVTAGVYLICRLSFLFVLSPPVMTIIAFTGALTALFAAVLALIQNDIKRVLAYSTVSQLGFMFLGVGVGAFTAGFFHVFTHAFFKACLFLGAGSVIHAMHARVHDEVRSQDMRNMGGLRKYMPLTYWTFVAATLAIVGFPFTSGWFSKDEIIASALVNRSIHPFAEMLSKRKIEIWTAPTWVPWVLWGIAITAATLTAFYMSRCVFMTFWGDFRGWTIGRASQTLKESEGGEDHGHAQHHHEDDLTTPGPAPHESPRAMTIPLLVLATASIVAGAVLNPAAFRLFKRDFDGLPMDHWLEPVFEEASPSAFATAGGEHVRHNLELASLGAALAAFAIGTYVAYHLYVRENRRHEGTYLATATRVAAAATGGLLLAVAVLIFVLPGGESSAGRALVAGLLGVSGVGLIMRAPVWGLDWLYERTVISGVDALADTAASVDQGFVDFLLARVTALLVAALGTILRVLQNGVVHVYAAAMVVGLTALGWFFVEPHADVAVTETAGDYTFVAGPGMGYRYRWFPEAGGKPQADAFGGAMQLKIHLDEGKSQTVKLEVQNAFGRQTTREITVTRPKVEKPMQLQLGER